MSYSSIQFPPACIRVRISTGTEKKRSRRLNIFAQYHDKGVNTVKFRKYGVNYIVKIIERMPEMMMMMENGAAA